MEAVIKKSAPALTAGRDRQRVDGVAETNGTLTKGLLMLVLSRKLGQSIQIGRDVVIQVVRIHGGKVRLGVTAPKTTRVLRAETADQDRTRDDR